MARLMPPELKAVTRRFSLYSASGGRWQTPARKQQEEVIWRINTASIQSLRAQKRISKLKPPFDSTLCALSFSFLCVFARKSSFTLEALR
jgi:hypothetical protein